MAWVGRRGFDQRGQLGGDEGAGEGASGEGGGEGSGARDCFFADFAAGCEV